MTDVELGDNPVEHKGLRKAVDMYQENLEGELWWMQDNEYLYRGYRSQLSFWDSLKSMGRSTNETLNIWTHFIGVLLFISLLFLTYQLPTAPFSEDGILSVQNIASVKTTSSLPRWPITIFTCSAIFCLSGSAIFHNFYCISQKVSDILQTIDYIGICILISGSYVPVIYYSFLCYPFSLKFHLIVIVVLNIITVSVLATPKFRSPQYRSLRSICFTSVSCYAVFALIQLYILDGFKNPLFTHMFWYIVGMGGSYIFGAFLYGSRIPEKYFPGHFDYVFASHQLFHVCIVIAALFHYVGSYQLYIGAMSHVCKAH